MTFEPGGPLARRDSRRGRAASGVPRRVPPRVWLLGVAAVVVLLFVAGNGGRAWWARRLGDLTDGNRTADFVIGLAVGVLPLAAVALASRARRRRVVRMFVAGAAGFVAADLLAPSVTTALRHSGGAATRPFSAHVPGYLAGFYTGVGVEVLVLVIAVVAARRAWRHRRLRRP